MSPVSDGRLIDGIDGVGEWLPGNGSAISRDGRMQALLYALPVEGGNSVRIVTASLGATGWSIASPTETDRAMGLHPGAIAWCGDRWLIVTWSEITGGIRISGRWMEHATLALSRPFDLGTERDRTYQELRQQLRAGRSREVVAALRALLQKKW